MGIVLSSIGDNSVSVDVDYFGEIVKVFYRPNEIIDSVVDGLKAEDFDKWIVENVIVSWDIKETANKKLPKTLSGWKKLPVPLQRAIIKSILSHNSVEDSGEAES